MHPEPDAKRKAVLLAKSILPKRQVLAPDFYLGQVKQEIAP